MTHPARLAGIGDLRQHRPQLGCDGDRIGQFHPPPLLDEARDGQGCRRGHGSLPMIELGVRTARSPPGPCPRPYLHSRVPAAQRLLTATLPTPCSPSSVCTITAEPPASTCSAVAAGCPAGR